MTAKPKICPTCGSEWHTRGFVEMPLGHPATLCDNDALHRTQEPAPEGELSDAECDRLYWRHFDGKSESFRDLIRDAARQERRRTLEMVRGWLRNGGDQVPDWLNERIREAGGEPEPDMTGRVTYKTHLLRG